MSRKLRWGFQSSLQSAGVYVKLDPYSLCVLYKLYSQVMLSKNVDNRPAEMTDSNVEEN